MNGIVKFYNETKGFGFIKEDGSETEVFFHATGLSGEKPRQNDKVSYEVQKGKKGINAINVTVVK